MSSPLAKDILGVVEIVVGVIVNIYAPGSGAGLIALGVGTLAGGILQQLQERPPANALPGGIKANVRGTNIAHNLVFGKGRVGGIIVSASTSGMNNERMAFVLAHSICHPGGCAGIGRIWFDDQEIPATSLSATAQAGYTAYAITNAAFAQKPYFALNFYPGLATQATGKGICYSTVVLTRDMVDDAAFQKAFKGHIPQVTVELKGLLVYDPRLDSTNGGAGAQRLADATTWAWSDNPALCTATYMMMAALDGGMGIPSTSIDWVSVAAAASSCDEVVVSPAGNIPRYRVSAMLSTQDKRTANLGHLLDAMAGYCVRVGSLYKIFAGVYRTPSFTIDETWLAGPVEITTKTELGQLYNAVRLTYPDENQAYHNVDAPAFTNPAYEVQDGGSRIYKDINLPTCPNPYQAQALAAQQGNRSRRQMLLKLPCNWKGLNIEVWETGTVSLVGVNLGGKVFRCTSWVWGDSGPVLQLQEENSADYTLPAFVQVVTPAPNTSDPAWAAPPAATGLSARAVADGIALAWSYPDSKRTLRSSISRSPHAANTFTFLASVAGSFYTDPVTDGAQYDYQVTIISDYGVSSPVTTIAAPAAKTVANGADVTSQNTAADTAKVNGVAAVTVQSNAATGYNLTVPNSGVRLGDARNATAILGMNKTPAIQSTNPLTATSSPTAATIAIASHTWKTAFGTITYNSGSVAGLALSTLYYIYADDANIAGGAVTYVATTAASDITASGARVFIGTITTPAASGSSSGTEGACVAVDSFMGNGVMARDIEAGDVLHTMTDSLGFGRHSIDSVGSTEDAPCYRIEMQGGAAVVCSESTPLTLADGRRILMPQLQVGDKLATLYSGPAGYFRDGQIRFEPVTQIEAAGIQPVVRIHIGGRSYAAGENPLALVFTHNPLKP